MEEPGAVRIAAELREVAQRNQRGGVPFRLVEPGEHLLGACEVRLGRRQVPELAGKQTLTSLWQFELIISISPPVPTFSLEFDEALQFVDMRLPLDRRIYKRVRLLSVQ